MDQDLDWDRDEIGLGDSWAAGFAGLCEDDILLLTQRESMRRRRSWERPVVVPNERGVPIDEHGNFVDVDAHASRRNGAQKARNKAILGLIEQGRTK